MKRLFVFSIIFLWAGIGSVSAQDFIDLKNRNTILGKVLGVSQTDIRYSNSKSIEMTIPRDDVYTIRYENGRVENINPIPAAHEQRPATVVTSSNKQRPQASTTSSTGQKPATAVASSAVEQRPQTTAASSVEQRPQTTARQTPESGQSAVPASVSQSGDLNLVRQALNLAPAVPIAGKNLKFEFGAKDWTAKVNGNNFLSGDCVFERKGDGYAISLKPTNVWSGAVDEVVDLMQNIGVPLGPAAGPLKTAAKLASKVAKWLPLKGSAIVLDYDENSPVPLKLRGK